MYNVLVSLTKADSPLPSGVVFGHTNLDVTDAAGAVQNFSLNGAEIPPWTVPVAGLADGQSSYVAQDVDANGAPIGGPIRQTYTPVPVTFPSTTAINVSPA